VALDMKDRHILAGVAPPDICPPLDVVISRGTS
jgi:hypothetical protein